MATRSESNTTSTNVKGGTLGSIESNRDVKREPGRDGHGRWVITIDGHEAQMTYSTSAADVVAINHTYVPAELRGRGLAQRLMVQAITDARADSFRIVPNCSFVREQFEAHPEWADLRA